MVFFLGSTEQYKAMKIGIAFFGSKLDLWCISKVLSIFWTFSKFGLEERRSRGHVACSPSAREVSRCGALGPGALGELREGFSGHGPLGELPGGALGARPRGTRGGLGSIRGSSQRECPLDTRRTRRAPGCGLRVRHSGTGGVLGDIRRKSPGRSTRGQVSRSEASGVNITRWTRGALGGW